MEIITVECPKCHGSLHVDQNVDKIFCMYCRAEVTVKNLQATGVTVVSLIKRGFLLVEHHDWEKALEVFDKAADIDPENAQIYLGMLLAETKIEKESLLDGHHTPLSHYKSYQKAIKFADEDLKQRLSTYNERIIERAERMIEQAEKEKEQAALRAFEMEVEIEKQLIEKTKYGKCFLISFLYSMVAMEIISLINIGEFNYVNLGLFRNWHNYNDPVIILISSVVIWVIIWSISYAGILNSYETKIRKEVEQDFLG